MGMKELAAALTEEQFIFSFSPGFNEFEIDLMDSGVYIVRMVDGVFVYTDEDDAEMEFWTPISCNPDDVIDIMNNLFDEYN